MKHILKKILTPALSQPLTLRLFEALNRHRLRILYYHRVIEDRGLVDVFDEGMFVGRDAFDAQMKWVRERYHPVTEADVISAIEGKTKLPLNAVWVTFDDGYKDNFTLAAPALKKYGILATFFVTTGYINKHAFPVPFRKNDVRAESLFMSWDDIRALSRDGFAVGAHTVSHPVTSKITQPELEEEITASVAEIEQQTGQKVYSFAYPFGKSRHINPVKAALVLHDLGISLAVTTTGGTDRDIQKKRFSLRRFGFSSTDEIGLFRFKIAAVGGWQK